MFKGLVKWCKNSVEWHYGFKLHLLINKCGELLSFKLTSANVDEGKLIADLTKDLIGKLFADRDYISQQLFEELYERGLQLITRFKKNMKNRLLNLIDKLSLCKLAVIESVLNQLKNLCQIEHSRHQSGFNFLVNLMAGERSLYLSASKTISRYLPQRVTCSTSCYFLVLLTHVLLIFFNPVCFHDKNQ